MVQISNCCNNLNGKKFDEMLGEDTITQVVVTTSPTLILPADSNRGILKIYVLSFSVQTTELWLRHGTTISIANSGFQIPLRHLFVNTSQASQALRGICTVGTATIRITTANKL